MHPKIAEAYQLLDISSTATLEEIKKAFRKLAKEYHPDTHSGKANEEKFILISEAYELILDFRSNPLKYSVYKNHTSSSTQSSSYHPKSRHSEEELKERMKRAREMARENELANQEAIYRAYSAIRTPKYKYSHLVVTVLCFIISTLITIDYFSTEQQRSIEIQSVSNLYGSSKFVKTTALSTYNNEVFYVEYSLLSDMIRYNYEFDSREAYIYESSLLKIPRKVSILRASGQSKTYAIDEAAYLYYPVILLLLLCSMAFYLLRSKKHFKDVILYYASFGLSILGLFIAFSTGLLRSIVAYIWS